MSIINDALKKVEKSLGYDYSAVAAKKNIPPPGPRVNNYLIYALIFVFGLFLENTFFLYFFRPQAGLPGRHYLQTQNTPLQLSSQELVDLKEELPGQPVPETTQVTLLEPPAAPAAPADEEKAEKDRQNALVLNGIFFSQDNGYYALINNKIVKEGDDIEGAIVKSIDLNNVELESKGGKLVKLSKGR